MKFHHVVESNSTKLEKYMPCDFSVRLEQRANGEEGIVCDLGIKDKDIIKDRSKSIIKDPELLRGLIRHQLNERDREHEVRVAK